MQVKSVAILALLSCLTACASLPTSGPTGKQVVSSAADSSAGGRISVIQINAAQNLPAPDLDKPGELPELAPPPTDMVGTGDVLDIVIYEAGVSLFSGASGIPGASGSAQVAVDAGVKSQHLPPSRVNDNGDILIPYAGKLHVIGRTVGEIEKMVRSSLRGLSQNPQVVVTIRDVITNSVIVSGEVARPGRLVLQTNNETLSDVIALAGGYRGSTKDLILRVTRRATSVDLRLNELIDNPSLDTRAYPGDRIMLISAPRSFSVLGASGRVEQLPFPRARLSLAEAVAAAGGVNPSQGDPAAIFLFRYVKDAQGVQVPTVYHLNMMQTGSFFLSQRFTMRDGDILYFGNASSNRPAKLLQLVSQLFSPIMTVTSAVQTVQNSH